MLLNGNAVHISRIGAFRASSIFAPGFGSVCENSFSCCFPITTISVAAHGTCAPKGSVLRPGRICVFFRSSAAVRLCGDCVLLWCFPDCSRRLRTVAALGTCRPEESTLMLRSLGRVGACRTQNTYPNLLVLLFIKDAHSGDFSTPNLFLRASNQCISSWHHRHPSCTIVCYIYLRSQHKCSISWGL